MFTLKFNIDDAPKGIARRFDSRYDVVIRTLDDGTRTELHPMLQTPSGEYVRFEDYAKLVEKCERLTKAGDAMAKELIRLEDRFNGIESAEAKMWYIAKERGCP